MTRLPIAALAFALIAQAPAARAETLNLVCENDQRGSIELLVDFDRKTVELMPRSSCTWNISGRSIVVPDCFPPGRAQISERDISWAMTEKTVNGAGGVGEREVSGSLNRLTGNVWMRFGSVDGFSGKCRRATKQF
jgi:hypothetical protein